MSTGDILLGVVAGVAIGGALGILFAPDKGSTTRRKIAEKSDDYADQLSAKFNEFIEGVTEKFEKMKEEVIKNAEAVGEEAIPEETSAVG